MRSDNVDDVLVITLDLHGAVSSFPIFKPSQQEFETCNRYELTYASLEYDPSSKTLHDQEAGMTDSWGNIKVEGNSTLVGAMFVHSARKRQKSNCSASITVTPLPNCKTSHQYLMMGPCWMNCTVPQKPLI
jgi:hypothetical protein